MPFISLDFGLSSCINLLFSFSFFGYVRVAGFWDSLFIFGERDLGVVKEDKGFVEW